MGNISVRFFDAGMSGAPVITTASAGTIISVLDACLVTGFGSVALSSLVVASEVATATVTAGHGFVDYKTGVIGCVLRIAGATPAGLNGDWRCSVQSSTVFTFACPGVANGTATGTITALRAPAGWTKPYSGTNLAAYRGNTTSGSGWYFRIDNTSTTGAEVVPYKTMSNINTGTRAGLTAQVINAWNQTGSSPWWLIYADDRTVYLRITEKSASEYMYLVSFGDFAPAAAIDADCAYAGGYGFFVSRITDCDDTNLGVSYIANALLKLASGYADRVSRVGTLSYPILSNAALNDSGFYLPGTGAGNLPYPNALTGQCDSTPIAVLESGSVRGALRGAWAPQHLYSALPTTAVLLPNDHMGSRLLLESNISSNRYGALLMDLTGPW